MKIDRTTTPAKVTSVEDGMANAMLKSTGDEETPVEFINSGSTLLNLAFSGKGKNGGFPRGRISNLVGDGSSGKTLIALELSAYIFHKMLGNISHNFPQVKKIKIIFDNIEGVMDFPVAKMYGKSFFDSVEWINSETVQSWGRNVAREIMSNKPGEMLLYITDSLDALSSEEGQERFEEAAKNDKPEAGSFSTEKAAYLSKNFFQNMCSMIKGKDVTLIIISQIRVKFDVKFGEKYNRAGGKSLDFYTHLVSWFYEIEKLKKTFRGEERVYGIRILSKIKRSKVGKPFREAELQILFDYGIDDISSSLAYLYGPKVKLLTWDGVDYSRNDLIKYIEENNLQNELAERVEIAWNEIEDAIKPDRKPRYENL